MSELKQTPLYALHETLQAKIVPFAGYRMPLHYPGGIIAEHLHCRSQAGFFDISHMGQCLIKSENAAAQLETLTPAAIQPLQPGQLRYTVLTNESGGIIDDIIISRVEDGYLLVVNAACKEKDFALLKSRFGNHFHSLPELALFALQGPAAAQIMQQLAPQACQLHFMRACTTTINGYDCMISRSGYSGEDGFEISAANSDAGDLADIILSFDPVRPIGLGARDTLRLEAALSLYGHELNETTTPVEAGLSWVINKQNRQFPGAQIIHDQLQHGAPRKRLGLLVEGKIPVREHCPVHDEQGNQVGLVTSGGYSPTLNRPIALALVDASCHSQTLYSQVRNREISLPVTSLPFVPHRYHKG